MAGPWPKGPSVAVMTGRKIGIPEGFAGIGSTAERGPVLPSRRPRPTRQHTHRHGLVERPPPRLGARRAADHQKVRPAPSQHDPDLPATLAPQRHPAHVAALGPNCHRRSLYPAEVVAFNGDRARRIISKEVALGCSPE